jgi:hypothetical protein
MASLRHTRDPQRRVFFCARWTHDVLTAVASVGDLVFDVLVAIQFYRDHYMIYCTLSIIIFAIAQACYAFLFTSAYASHLPPSKRALVFVVVLPIAQITPVFAWIESLHWPRLQRLMLRMDLRPSDDVRPLPKSSVPPRAAPRPACCLTHPFSRRRMPEGTRRGCHSGQGLPLTRASWPRRSSRRCRSACCRPCT